MILEDLDDLNLPSEVIISHQIENKFLSKKIVTNLQNLRKTTIADNFLKALKTNQLEKIDEFLDYLDFQDSVYVKSSGDAIKLVLENNNFNLALKLQKNGFQASPIQLLESITEHKVSAINGLIRFNFYDVNYLAAYLWYLLSENYEEFAHDLIINNENLLIYQQGLVNNNMKSILKNINLSKTALEQAFIIKYDILAELIVMSNPQLVSMFTIQLALENESIKLLKLLSTGLPSDPKRRVQSQFKELTYNHLNLQESQNIKEILELSQIIDYFITNNKLSKLNEIIYWPEIQNIPGLLLNLIEANLEEAAKTLLRITKIEPSAKEFFFAFEKNFYDLCILMLSDNVKRVSLANLDLQSKLVELAKVPESCLQSMEVLSRITNNLWRKQLTKELCINIQYLIKKTENIIYCSNPIMFCILSAEFLTRISALSYENRSRCLKTVDLLIDLAQSIQVKIKGEKDLSYFLLQKDSKGRAALSIIAENRFLKLLEDDDLIIIIENLWEGSLQSYDYFDASTVYASLCSQYSSSEATAFFHKISFKRKYIFQYEEWLLSCKLRFFIAQGISIIILLILENILIYRAIELNAFWNLNNIPETKGELRLLQGFVLGIAGEQILHSLFAWKTKRFNLINSWKMLDIAIIAIVLLISFQEYQGFGGDYSYITGSNKKYSVNVFHSILIVLLWIKLASVFVVSWSYGPFIRIIYFMILETLNFFIILFGLYIGSAGGFTAVFNQAASTIFPTFDIALRTTISAGMGTFDLTQFTSNVAIGSIIYGIYLAFSMIVLVNLLIAIISSVYDKLVEKVESEHRAVIISYADKYKWDNSYGILIFLPPPLSLVAVALSPFVIFAKNPEKINEFLCKIAYVCYAIPQFAIFAGLTFLSIVPLYLKGFLIYTLSNEKKIDNDSMLDSIQTERLNKFHSKELKMLCKGITWAFIGLPIVLLAGLRDCIHFWQLAFQKSNKNEIEAETEDVLKFELVMDANFIKTIQKTLKNIITDEIPDADFYYSWKLFDGILNPISSTDRLLEAEEYFKQFSRKDLINIEHMKRLLPKVKGGVYNDIYLNRARYLNPAGILAGIKKFHSTIGALNISGVTIPKPELHEEYDMTKINRISGIIREIEESYATVTDLSIKILEKIEKNDKDKLDKNL